MKPFLLNNIFNDIKQLARTLILLIGFPLLFAVVNNANGEDIIITSWKKEWPKTDFTKSTVDLTEIISGGPPKDGIPAIDKPIFSRLSEVIDIKDTDPVISVTVGDDARTYPVSILMYHEIVNNEVGGKPLSITYCPLCNSALVFERQFEGLLLDFGTTGKLRHSDMVMYDRQTESWWQQFTGDGIVGRFAGKKLKTIPSRIESFGNFRKRHPDGKVLIPNNPTARPYGNNPYVGYDSAEKPFLFRGDYDGPIPPLARVIAVGNDAWPLSEAKERKVLRHGDIVIRWHAGQSSALDTRDISTGREIGNVTVFREVNGSLEEIVYHLPFAFAYATFHPEGVIHGK